MLHGEHTLGKYSCQFMVGKRDKYIWYSEDGREQYFDLAQDPREECNRIKDPGYQIRIEEMRLALVRALNGREEGYVSDSQLIPGRLSKSILQEVLGIQAASR